MNKFTKMAVVAAGAALAVQGALAGPNNNNLIFSVNNNNNSGTTEFTVNLGQQSSFTGPNFDLSSLLTTFESQFTSAAASGLNVGVVGGQNGQGGLAGTGNDVYTTTLRLGGGSYLTAGTESAPTPNPSKAVIANAGAITGGFSGYGSNLAIGDPTSFSSNIALNPTTPGTAQNSFSSYLGAGANPLQTMTGTTITLDLWQDTVTSSSTTSGWVYQGDFTLDLSGPSPTLTWDAAAVPEPSTYSLCIGAGLLGLAFRRHFRRKNS